jgi:hypothetical protein
MTEMLGKTYNEAGTDLGFMRKALCADACLDNTKCVAVKHSYAFCTSYTSSQPHNAIDSTASDSADDAVFEKTCPPGKYPAQQNLENVYFECYIILYAPIPMLYAYFLHLSGQN